MLPWTAAQVLIPPDGAFKTHTSLCHNLNQAALDCLIFVQRNKTVPAGCNLPSKKLRTTIRRATQTNIRQEMHNKIKETETENIYEQYRGTYCIFT